MASEPARDMDDMVRIRHSDVGVSPNPVTRRAAELVWHDLGWEIVADSTAEKADAAASKATAKKEA